MESRLHHRRCRAGPPPQPHPHTPTTLTLALGLYADEAYLLGRVVVVVIVVP